MRRFVSLLVNAFIFVVVYVAWTRLFFRFSEQGVPVGIVRESLRWLKYFTVLSNLLMGLSSLLYLFGTTLMLCGVIRRVPGFIRMLKYMATVSLMLTFCVVIAWIGPATGFRHAYTGVNLWFHLIVPLAAALDFMLLDRTGRLPFAATLGAVVPALLYGGWYLGNILKNGAAGNDWYGFAAGGPATMPMVFAAVLLADWVLALLLWLPRRARRSGGKRGTEAA